MDDALVVGVLQRLTDRWNDGERLLRRQRSFLEHIAEIHPVHVFHYDVVEPVGFAEIMDRHDVRVVHLRQGLGFPFEAFCESRIAVPLACQHLDRHDAVERLLPRLVNDAHTAAP